MSIPRRPLQTWSSCRLGQPLQLSATVATAGSCLATSLSMRGVRLLAEVVSPLTRQVTDVAAAVLPDTDGPFDFSKPGEPLPAVIAYAPELQFDGLSRREMRAALLRSS